MRMVPKINDDINKLFEHNRLKMNTQNIAIKHIWLNKAPLLTRKITHCVYVSTGKYFLRLGQPKHFKNKKQWEQ